MKRRRKKNSLVGVHDLFVFGVVDAGNRHGIYITKATSIRRRTMPVWSKITSSGCTTNFVEQKCWRFGRRIYALINVTIMIIPTCCRLNWILFGGNESLIFLNFKWMIFVGCAVCCIQRNLFGWVNCFVRNAEWGILFWIKKKIKCVNNK